jgi:hypothetical protein
MPFQIHRVGEPRGCPGVSCYFGEFNVDIILENLIPDGVDRNNTIELAVE